MTKQRLTRFDIHEVRGGYQEYSHLTTRDPIYEQVIADGQNIQQQHFDLQSIYDTNFNVD
jgi:hypothetical protein